MKRGDRVAEAVTITAMSKEIPMPYYKICSNPRCDYSSTLNHDEIAYLHDLNTYGEPSMEFVEISEFADRCCAKCRSPLLLFCPHCKRSLFDTPEVVFCASCGQRIKSDQ